MGPSIDTIDFHGIPALRLATRAGARAVVSLFGGQVLSWAPAQGEERLYLSDKAVFDGQTPIRGGVPVCFPQFAGQGALPKHGFARSREWSVAEQRTGDDFALVTLCLGDDEGTRALWPQGFSLELSVIIEESRLDMELDVQNTGDTPFDFTAALHTYLRVREVEESRLEGLYGLTYSDTADGGKLKRESGEAVLVEDETDRIYRDSVRPLLLREYDRSLGLNSEGFPDVVVWNPWEERCAALADMPADGFRRMLCVEAAAANHPIHLAPGQRWWGRQTLIAL
ncbi:D-hexose-6-phosphate mutarotase [Azoarcus sp. TTM-91]|uniref:D-hexose-6-phosphate mutarotase n=1 Tax=Azoarcus sp. TTM-91 TaxID=2691581 RepID=UPI00145DA2CA|nr:D-hexose-6-phosphate mutarotase [Azoarcus sp. TTM-91]NMG33655.1 D-hexose-6-phosphate mutarotase [Azoarcus sp. TTM-91]